jgi:hypothetical protein
MLDPEKIMSDILSDRRLKGGTFGSLSLRIVASLVAGASIVGLYYSIPINANPDRDQIAISIFLATSLFWFYALSVYVNSVKRDFIRILKLRGIEGSLLQVIHTDYCPESVKSKYAKEITSSYNGLTMNETKLARLFDEVLKESRRKDLAKRAA